MVAWGTNRGKIMYNKRCVGKGGNLNKMYGAKCVRGRTERPRQVVGKGKTATGNNQRSTGKAG